MRSRIKLLIVIALGLPLLVGCAANMPKTVEGFDVIAGKMDKVTVMPPHFTLGEVGAFSEQTVSDMNHDIELEVKRSADALMAESRYAPAPLEAGDSALAADSELRRMLGESTQEIGRIAEGVRNTKGKVIDVPYTGNLDYFSDITNADYLLFLSGSGWFKTGGAKAKEAATGIVLAAIFGAAPTSSPGSATTLEAFLVDANLGKVIWYNAVSYADRDPRKPRDLLSTSQALMAPLLGKSTIKGDKSRDNELINKYEARLDEKK